MKPDGAREGQRVALLGKENLYDLVIRRIRVMEREELGSKDVIIVVSFLCRPNGRTGPQRSP